MNSSILSSVKAGFISTGWPVDVVGEALEAFKEAKGRYYRADLRASAVEGGRFSEAILRLLQFIATGSYTALSDRKFKADVVMNQLEKIPSTQASDSVRLNIPRALRLIYDIRNNRDTAHLRDGIDPNLQDATLVVSCMDWCLAELVRMGHNVSPDQAQKLIENIVAKEVPVIQEFDGKPLLLVTLKASDCVLALLYWQGDEGVPLSELRTWLPGNIRRNLARTLTALTKAQLIYVGEDRPRLTRLGVQYVERQKLLQPV